MQSVLKKWAFSAGALALSVGLSACGKVKDMPSSDKQSQTEAPAGDAVPKSFQGIWSHDRGGIPADGETHLKIEADGTLNQLESFQVLNAGSATPTVSLKYKVVGKLTMQTLHSVGLDASGDFLAALQKEASKIGVLKGNYEVIRHTSRGNPQLCILAWEDDHGGFLDSSDAHSSDTYCFERFDLTKMEDYLRDTAKQCAGQ